MSTPEFSFIIDRRQLTDKPITLVPTADERSALARRFALVAINTLEATVTLATSGEAIEARGRLTANVVQSCAVSREDLPVTIDEAIALRFVPARQVEEEEIELDEHELDEIPFKGDDFDLGEAVAQSLALAIDPYATGPSADRVRKEVGLADETTSGPFAALATLKKP